MTGRLMRRVLALPAPLIRGRSLALGAPWLPPGRRQLSLTHPTGWLAHDALLSSFSCAAGEVHYRGDGGTAFAVGVEGMNPDLLGSWAETMRQKGMRQILIFPVAKWERGDLNARGFDAMRVGEEAEIYLPSYTLRGAHRANLRQMINRARRQGLTVHMQTRLDSEGLALQEAWRRHCPQPRPMELLVGSGDPQSAGMYVVVRAPDGTMVAWLRARPGYNKRGWGLDDMVRGPGAPPGAMELAVDFFARAQRDAGATWLSLGAVPLRGVDQGRPWLGPVCKALHDTDLGNRLFRFSGLGRFKAKFNPRWRPVYLATYGRVGMLSLYEGCRLWRLF